MGVALLVVDFSFYRIFQREEKKQPEPQEEDLRPHFVFMDNLRSYSELCQLATDLRQNICNTVKSISEFRVQRRDTFTAIVAVSCITLGSLLNRISGATVSYIFIWFIILFPILERISVVREYFWTTCTFVGTKTSQLRSFIVTKSQRPMPADTEMVDRLMANLPAVAQQQALSRQASVHHEVSRTESFKAALAEHLQKSAPLPRRNSSTSPNPSASSNPLMSESSPAPTDASVESAPAPAPPPGPAPPPAQRPSPTEGSPISRELAAAASDDLGASALGQRAAGQDVDDGYTIISSDDVHLDASSNKKNN